MENYTEKIELINNYLNKSLSESDIESFENRLNVDALFKYEYEAHIILLEGLRRQNLKHEIKNARKKYLINKWLRYLGVSIAVLIISALIYVNAVRLSSINKVVNAEPTNNVQSVKTVLPKAEVVNTVVIADTLNEENLKTKKPKVLNTSAIQNPIKDIEIPQKAPEVFTVNASKNNSIICKEGTKIVIAANSFVNQNKTVVNGDVVLFVTEYYKISDMLLANLSTQSFGKQLETGGMLFIEAKQFNKTVQLKAQAHIEILFLAKTRKQNMQLFYGTRQEGSINWKLEENKTEDTEIVDDMTFENIEVPFSVIEQVPIYPGCEAGTNVQQRSCTSAAINKFIQRKFNTEVAANIGLTGRQSIQVVFRIDKNGNTTGVQARTSDPDLEGEAERVVLSLPKMIPGKQGGKNVVVPYSLPITFQVDSEIQQGAVSISDVKERNRKLDSARNKRLEDKLQNINNHDVSISEVKGYILRSLKLGWINCDRFVTSGNMVNYKLEAHNEGETRIYVVFKSYKSILPSRKSDGLYSFGMVPNNTEVILVAIKKAQGKLFLDTTETKINRDAKVIFNFREITVADLKNQLQKLDSLF